MQALNLVLHAGGNAVDRAVLDTVPVPEHTDTWYPIPHAMLLEQVYGSLAGAGLTVVNEAHALAREGARYFGLLQVANGHNADDYGLVIGLRNSHDQSFPAALACGSGVFVCDNLAFSGEIKIGRKHTRFIERDLPGLVTTALGRLNDVRRFQDIRIQEYKRTEITRTEADHLIVEMFRSRVINVQRIPEVLKEWEVPRHPEFSANGLTVWRLFNAVTESLKGRVAVEPRCTMALHGLLDTVCNVKPVQVEEVVE